MPYFLPDRWYIILQLSLTVFICDATLLRMSGRSPTVYPQGGFDCDFVEPPPNRLCCGICLRPLRDPLLTSCRHSFCTSCLGKNFQISQLCPVCNQRYTSFPDADIVQEVRALKVWCRNKQAGCEWTGGLEKVEEHMVNCGFTSLQCSVCGQLVQRRLMTKHQDLLCPLRQYDCDYCRTYFNTYNDVTVNHWPVCEFFPVPCPNDCPKGSIPRNRLMDHIRSECRVKKDGKQLAVVKSQHDNLLEKLRHLQKCLERKNEEIQDAGISIKELEKQQQEMATAMDELQEELWKKDKKISEMAVEQEELQRKLNVSLRVVSCDSFENQNCMGCKFE